MAKKKQKTLKAAGLHPELKNKQAVIGEFIRIRGRFWKRCAEEDKDKEFLCTVLEYYAMHK